VLGSKANRQPVVGVLFDADAWQGGHLPRRWASAVGGERDSLCGPREEMPERRRDDQRARPVLPFLLPQRSKSRLPPLNLHFAILSNSHYSGGKSAVTRNVSRLYNRRGFAKL
jgi:hypothetical protein